MELSNPGTLTFYVCGLLFNTEGTRVVLIRKNRPVWQAGLLNGIGGKVEPGEAQLEAMIREFREEVGIHIESWEATLFWYGDDYTVWFYRAFAQDAVLDLCESMTDEVVGTYEPFQVITEDVIPNLRWLIPFSRDPRCQLPLSIYDNFSPDITK